MRVLKVVTLLTKEINGKNTTRGRADIRGPPGGMRAREDVVDPFFHEHFDAFWPANERLFSGIRSQTARLLRRTSAPTFTQEFRVHIGADDLTAKNLRTHKKRGDFG